MYYIYCQDVCQKMKRMRVEDLSWTKEMVWLEKDAPNSEVNQVGTSACGATAVINTLVNFINLTNYIFYFYQNKSHSLIENHWIKIIYLIIDYITY